MSIRVYICRTEKPADAGNDPIVLQRWKDLVQEVPAMHLYEGDESLPAGVSAPESPSEGLARWAGHPEHHSVWLHYRDGLVYADGYDAYVVTRMRALALRLGARVRSESGAIF